MTSAYPVRSSVTQLEDFSVHGEMKREVRSVKTFKSVARNEMELTKGGEAPTLTMLFSFIQHKQRHKFLPRQ